MNTFPTLPPPELLYQVSRVADQSLFLDSARAMTTSLLDHLKRTGVPLAEDARVLDFGCGVGKVLIGLHEKLPSLDLYGCDLDPDVVAWCRSELHFAKCYRNDLLPPLAYDSRSFDFVNAISVFTHLSLAQQFQWAREIHRVLKPGGRFHFTTHGVGYLTLFAQVAATRPVARFDLYALGADAWFLDLEQPIEDEEHYRGKSGDARQGQLEVAVAHTPNAVKEIFAAFEVSAFVADGAIGNGHDAYVLTRPPGSAEIASWETWRTQDTSETDTIAFSLHLTGQDTFKVFVTAGALGVHLISPTLDVTGTLDDEAIVETQVPVSRGTRLFGNRDMLPITIDLGGPRSGRLNISVRIQGSRPWERTPDRLTWLAPCAYSRVPEPSA